MARTEAIRAEVASALAKGSTELRPQEFNVSSIVMSLVWDYKVEEIRVAADQWFGVYVKTKEVLATVECDLVEDGFVGAWRLIHDDFLEHNPESETE